MTRKPGTTRVWSLVLVGAAALSAAGETLAAPPPYAYATTACENTYFLVPTLASSVRGEVPERFGVLGEAVGVAVVGVMITECDMTLDGDDLGRVAWSDVGVLIDPPSGVFDGEPTIHVYRTWSLADAPEMVAANEAWGIETALTGVYTTYGPGLPVATSAGLVEAEFGDYSGQGVWGGVVHPAVEGTVTWWSVGPAGVVRFDQAFTNDTEQCGSGALTAEGRLASMIGASSVAPHGCITFADLIGEATLVEPAP